MADAEALLAEQESKDDDDRTELRSHLHIGYDDESGDHGTAPALYRQRFDPGAHEFDGRGEFGPARADHRDFSMRERFEPVPLGGTGGSKLHVER